MNALLPTRRRLTVRLANPRGFCAGVDRAIQIVEIEHLRLQTVFANAIRGLMLHDTFVAAENGKRAVAVCHA